MTGVLTAPSGHALTGAQSDTKIVDAEEGVVDSVVSVTANVDLQRDLIVPGAHKRFLHHVWPKMVWSHDWATPIGKALEVEELMPGSHLLPPDLREAGYGALRIRSKLNLAKQQGRDALEDIKFYEGEQEWSIGYEPVEAKLASQVESGSPLESYLQSKNSDGMAVNRLITGCRNWEYSPVLFGANRDTRTLAAKRHFGVAVPGVPWVDNNGEVHGAGESGAAMTPAEQASPAEQAKTDARDTRTAKKFNPPYAPEVGEALKQVAQAGDEVVGEGGDDPEDAIARLESALGDLRRALGLTDEAEPEEDEEPSDDEAFDSHLPDAPMGHVQQISAEALSAIRDNLAGTSLTEDDARTIALAAAARVRGEKSRYDLDSPDGYHRLVSDAFAAYQGVDSEKHWQRHCDTVETLFGQRPSGDGLKRLGPKVSTKLRGAESISSLIEAVGSEYDGSRIADVLSNIAEALRAGSISVMAAERRCDAVLSGAGEEPIFGVLQSEGGRGRWAQRLEQTSEEELTDLSARRASAEEIAQRQRAKQQQPGFEPEQASEQEEKLSGDATADQIRGVAEDNPDAADELREVVGRLEAAQIAEEEARAEADAVLMSHGIDPAFGELAQGEQEEEAAAPLSDNIEHAANETGEVRLQVSDPSQVLATIQNARGRLEDSDDASLTAALESAEDLLRSEGIGVIEAQVLVDEALAEAGEPEEFGVSEVLGDLMAADAQSFVRSKQGPSLPTVAEPTAPPAPTEFPPGARVLDPSEGNTAVIDEDTYMPNAIGSTVRNPSRAAQSIVNDIEPYAPGGDGNLDLLHPADMEHLAELSAQLGEEAVAGALRSTAAAIREKFDNEFGVEGADLALGYPAPRIFVTASE